MKSRAWQSTAFSSLLLACGLAAATRPHYGGTLRIQLLSPPTAVDADESGRILALVGDTLVATDPQGAIQSRLATEWQHDAANKRWRFRLRPRVLFHDGSMLAAADVADSLSASLHMLSPAPTVTAAGEFVVIEAAQPMPLLAVELAQPRHSIVKHGTDNLLTGTGPFRLSPADTSAKVICTAFEDYWAGRPFLDSIEITGPQTKRTTADVIELPANAALREVPERSRLWTSAASDLIAVYIPETASQLRDAFEHSLDRAPIASVLTQRRGQPAYSLLPEWMSGYAFVFETKPDRERARLAAAKLANSAVIVGYLEGDPLVRLVAERLVLNARDLGIQARLGTPGEAMMRVVRIHLPMHSGPLALREIARQFGLPQRADAAGPQALYEEERGLLESRQVVPVVFVPTLYAVSARVRAWDTAQPLRSRWWQLENVWLAP